MRNDIGVIILGTVILVFLQHVCDLVKGQDEDQANGENNQQSLQVKVRFGGKHNLTIIPGSSVVSRRRSSLLPCRRDRSGANSPERQSNM